MSYADSPDPALHLGIKVINAEKVISRKLSTRGRLGKRWTRSASRACMLEKFLRLGVEEVAKSQSEVRELERGAESADLNQ